MRGLTVVIATAERERFEAALTLASASGALGARTRLYFHDAAVRLLERDHLVDTALDVGVTFVACQSGLAAHDRALPDFAEGGGMVSLLATLDDDRMVVV